MNVTATYRKEKEKGHIVITGSSYRTITALVGEMSGIRAGERGEVILPPDYYLYKIIRATIPITPTIELTSWLTAVERYETQRRAILTQKAAQVEHPVAEIMRPYQKAGAAAIGLLKNIMLCDECGLGKTIQAIVGIELSEEKEYKLIICPKSLLYTWAEEIAKWAQDKRVTILETSTLKKQMQEYTGGWVIVNYRGLLFDQSLAGIKWDWVICDEAHAIKNRKTQTYQRVSKFAYKHILLITGTPIGNTPTDAWTLLHLCNPTKYPSYWRFYEKYVEYETNPFSGYRKDVGPKNAMFLAEELSSMMLRRKKQEVFAQLPAKVKQRIEVAMDKPQRAHYDKMANEFYIQLQSGDDLIALSPLAVITRLRQIVSTTANFDLPDLSAKLDAAMDIIQGTDEKVIVFTQFRKTVEALAKRLQDNGISHRTVMGGMEGEEIEEAKYAINNQDCRVLVATLASGGVGLTLTGASVAIFIDQHWNPITQEQAEDRIHRIGQTKTVHIIILSCQHSIDALVEDIIARKLQIVNEVLLHPLLDHLRPAVGAASSLL